MKQRMKDFRVTLLVTTAYCDNTSVINISKNLLMNSRTKHIDIRYHFIRKLVENRTVELKFVFTRNQLTEVFTKVLDAARFVSLKNFVDIYRV